MLEASSQIRHSIQYSDRLSELIIQLFDANFDDLQCFLYFRQRTLDISMFLRVRIHPIVELSLYITLRMLSVIVTVNILKILYSMMCCKFLDSHQGTKI